MKKIYSLALWWWAARWFAHIWVLKYLEEKNIKIKEISGTSMWAIIWALYAIWKNSKEIQEIAEHLKIISLIDFDMRLWFIRWNKILKKLESIFWDANIEDSRIDLKIVASSLVSWEKVVFKKWRIVDAIRASISIPWIIKPYNLWDDVLVDWWITSNLPIEVLKWKNIIAVSALKDIRWQLKTYTKFFWMRFNYWVFKMSYKILHRTILLMMKQNEERSINYSDKNVILISPDYWDLEYYNFNKVDKFIEVWYESVKGKKIF